MPKFKKIGFIHLKRDSYDTNFLRLKAVTLKQEDSLIISQQNNWNLVRLICAILVIYGHSFILFHNPGSTDWIQSHIAKNITYSGQIAVIIFFFVSGLLITNSIQRLKSIAVYALHRFFRIFPGLIMCLSITVFMVIPLITHTFQIKSSVKYLFLNGSLLTNVYPLGSAFLHNPYASVVNGSLWTLPNEVRCYCVILFLAILTNFIDKRKLITINLIVLFYLIYDPELVPLIGSNPATSGNSLYVINSIFFFLGSLAMLTHLGRLRNYLLLFFSYSFYLAWVMNPERHLLFFVSVVLFASYLTSSRWFKRIRIAADLSYGVYLYGFLVEQTISYLFPTTTPFVGFIASTGLSLILGYISWFAIEKRAINFSKKYGKLLISKRM